MQKIRAIIIEDEPQARQMLTTLLQDYCEDVHIIGHASNVKDGVDCIKKLLPDLVFLDIEMPNEKGLELFKYFDKSLLGYSSLKEYLRRTNNHRKSSA